MVKKPIIYHPGKILREEFLIPSQITPQELAQSIGVSSKEMNQIISEKKDLNKAIAASLAVYFSTAPTFWVNLQSNYDEEQVEKFWYKNSKKEIQPLSHYR